MCLQRSLLICIFDDEFLFAGCTMSLQAFEWLKVVLESSMSKWFKRITGSKALTVGSPILKATEKTVSVD